MRDNPGRCRCIRLGPPRAARCAAPPLRVSDGGRGLRLRAQPALLLRPARPPAAGRRRRLRDAGGPADAGASEVHAPDQRPAQPVRAAPALPADAELRAAEGLDFEVVDDLSGIADEA